MDLERQKARFKDDHGILTSENEDLNNKIEELKSDIVSVLPRSGVKKIQKNDRAGKTPGIVKAYF